VKKVIADGLITSGMTMRSFNSPLLNEHVESLMFSEGNNEEGKVTEVTKLRYNGWIAFFLHTIKRSL
jgi:hypothetical protein